jgi:hypothetical protein
VGKLIRTLIDNVSIGAKCYPINTVIDCDNARAYHLVGVDGAAEFIETDSYGVDNLAAATDKFGTVLALAAAAVTLDLTSLAAAGSSRDGSTTNFADVHSLIIRNCGTGTNTVTVGAAASTAFDYFFGGTTPTLKIPAGCAVALRTAVAAGLSTASKNNIKLDPGADTFKVTVAVSGISA